MKYTVSHEWIRVENGIGIVGITDHAQKELGDIVYLELPKKGKTLKAGEEVCVLESTKAAADIYSPVSGKIIAVNEALLSQLHQIHQSAEKEGWLFKIQLTDPKELEALLSLSEYQKLVT